MLPDLTIHQVQRDDLECEEGDRIVQVRPTGKDETCPVSTGEGRDVSS